MMTDCRCLAVFLLSLLTSCLAAIADDHSMREQAISRGLEWLASQQGDHGEWRFAAKAEPERALGASANEATGLVLLAFLGAGHTLDSTTFGLAIDQAVEFLAGNAFSTETGADMRGSGGTLASHAIAAFALCELCGMQKEPDDAIRKLAQAAVDQSVYWQSQNAVGGWGLEPRKPIHMRSTVWHLMLLSSAEDVGLNISDKAQQSALHSLRTLQTGDERHSTEGPYFGFSEPAQDPTATALGTYGHLLRDWTPVRPWVARQAEYLLSHGSSRPSAEGNYFLVEILFRLGEVNRPEDNKWELARLALVDQMVERQVATGDQRGSWPPCADGRGQNSRLALTVFNLMSIEVYYRFRPLSFGGNKLSGPPLDRDLSVGSVREKSD